MLDVTLIQFLHDLANPQLGFLARAVVIAIISAVACGVVGTYVVLRGMAFIGDAISHAIFPGLAIAFALQTSLLLGGAVAGAAVALLIAVFSQNRKASEDSVIGIFFAASFAVGMIIISRTDGYTASLTSMLFGTLTGVSSQDVLISLAVTVIIIAALSLLRPLLVATCLDRETARSMRIPVAAVDIVLYLAVTAAVVISVGTVGNILVLALLITPAATARLLTSDLTRMMWLAALIGALSSFFGIYLSWSIDLPAGATIVLLLTFLFVSAWTLHPLLRRPAPVQQTPRPVARRALAGAAALFLVSGAVLPVSVPQAAADPSCTTKAESLVNGDVHVITDGHQDIALHTHDGALRLGIFDDSSPAPDTPLHEGEFVVRVPSSLHQSIQALGLAGAPNQGWVLPQVQDPSVPWLGMSTTHVGADVLSASDAAVVRMHKSGGPGRVIAWQTEAAGGVATVLDSDNIDMTWDFPGNTHSHTGFVFTEAGAYVVTFSFELRGETYSLPVPFLVGDEADLADFRGMCLDSATSGGGKAAGSGGPAALAKDIAGIDRGIAALDKALDSTAKEAEKFLGLTPVTSAAPAPQSARASASRSPRTSATHPSAAAKPQPQRPYAVQPREPQASGSTGSLLTRRESGTEPASGSQPAHGVLGARTPAGSNPAATTAAAASAPAPAGDANAQAQPDNQLQDAATPRIHTLAAAASHTGFWAGLMAGVGLMFMLVGGAMSAYAFLGLRRGRP